MNFQKTCISSTFFKKANVIRVVVVLKILVVLQFFNNYYLSVFFIHLCAYTEIYTHTKQAYFLISFILLRMENRDKCVNYKIN